MPGAEKQRGDDLRTTHQVHAWRNRLEKEAKITRHVWVNEFCKQKEKIDAPNGYFVYYRGEDWQQRQDEKLKYQFDVVKDFVEFDPKTRIDTVFPEHKFHKKGLLTNGRQLTSNQKYGSRPPIDFLSTTSGCQRTNTGLLSAHASK